MLYIVSIINYLNTGTGYAWAGHSMAKLTFDLRSIPDHLTSPDNVGALALTGSSNMKIKNNFFLFVNLKTEIRVKKNVRKTTWMLALDRLELDKIKPNHKIAGVQSTSV